MTPPDVAPAPKPERALRADARRNREDIRQAALIVFREHGLTAPLELVAGAAGVSKGTIYHRYAGREALVDAVVNDLALLHIDDLIARCDAVEIPAYRFEHYLDGIWQLQYDEPAVSDVITRQIPTSMQLSELCTKASAELARLLLVAQDGGRIRSDLTAEDAYRFIWERGIVLRTGTRAEGDTDLRHRRYLLDGLVSQRAQ